MKNFLFAILITCLSFSIVYSQVYEPVEWDFSARKVSSNEVELVFKATIDEGWKMFSQNLEEDKGPVPTIFIFHQTNGFERVGDVTEGENLKEAYSDVFEMDLGWFEKETIFRQRIKVTEYEKIIGSIEFMLCNEDRCLPPDMKNFEIDITKLAPRTILKHAEQSGH